MKILDDPTASGGKAVSMPRDYQPLFEAAGNHRREMDTLGAL